MFTPNIMGRHNIKHSSRAQKIACHALILTAAAYRAAIENDAGQPETEVLYTELLAWLNQLNVWDEVDTNEKRILYTPLGEMAQKDAIYSTWYIEGAAVLAWALKRLDLPRHDQQIDPYEVAESVGFLSEDAAEVIGNARLRKSIELSAYRELLYAIHTRLRDFIRHRTKKDFASWMDQAWLEALRLDATHLIRNGDLAIDNKPIAEVEYMRVQGCENITRERHRAIVWLLDQYPTYFQTPVDT